LLRVSAPVLDGCAPRRRWFQLPRRRPNLRFACFERHITANACVFGRHPIGPHVPRAAVLTTPFDRSPRFRAREPCGAPCPRCGSLSKRLWAFAGRSQTPVCHLRSILRAARCRVEPCRPLACSVHLHPSPPTLVPRNPPPTPTPARTRPPPPKPCAPAGSLARPGPGPPPDGPGPRPFPTAGRVLPQGADSPPRVTPTKRRRCGVGDRLGRPSLRSSFPVLFPLLPPLLQGPDTACCLPCADRHVRSSHSLLHPRHAAEGPLRPLPGAARLHGLALGRARACTRMHTARRALVRVARAGCRLFRRLRCALPARSARASPST
jgi:hypothetical protein